MQKPHFWMYFFVKTIRITVILYIFLTKTKDSEDWKEISTFPGLCLDFFIKTIHYQISSRKKSRVKKEKGGF